MNAAKYENSPRLQRVIKQMRLRGEMSTRDIIDYAHVCAVSSIISELRDPKNGFTILRRSETKDGLTIHKYTLVEPAQQELNLG